MNLKDKNINIGKTLNKLSLHNFTGLLSIFILGLIDVFFLGLSSPSDFAIAILASPIIFIIVSLFIGFSNAKMVFLSKRIEKGFNILSKESNKIDFNTMIVLLILIILISLNIEKIVYLFNIEEPLFNPVVDYILIHYIGVFFCISNALKSSFLKANGDSKIPARIMLITALLNLILDPLFIFYFKMGASGAAWATTTSWFLAFIGFNYYYFKIKKISKQKLKTNIPELLKLSPSFVIGQLLNSFTLLIIMFFIGKFGTDYLSAVGFGIRIDKIVVIISFAYASALSVFIGQNKSDLARCRLASMIVLKNSVILSFLSSMAIYFGSGLLYHTFNLSFSVYKTLELFLFYNLLISFLNNIYTIKTSYLNVIENHNKVLLSNFIKTMLVLPVSLYFFINLYDFNGLFLALIFTNSLSIIVLSILTKNKFIKDLFKNNKKCLT